MIIQSIKELGWMSKGVDRWCIYKNQFGISFKARTEQKNIRLVLTLSCARAPLVSGRRVPASNDGSGTIT